MQQLRVVAVALFLLSGSIAAQHAAPSNLDRLKQLAEVSRRRAQLEMAGAPAFHLKATFEFLSAEGKVTGKGTLDELWQDARHYRQELSLPDSHQPGAPNLPLLEIDNGEQLWRTGKWVIPAGFSVAENALLKPFLEFPAGDRLSAAPSPSVGVETDCIATEPSLPDVPPETLLAQTTFCLAKNTHLLRTIVRPNHIEIAFNEIKSFEGKYIARAIDVTNDGRLFARVRIDSLVVPTDFSALNQPPPEDAQKLSFHRADQPYRTGELMRGQMIDAASLMTSPMGHQGTVVLKVHVGITGEVESAEVVSSPSSFLNGPAFTSAKRSRFRVSYQAGKPVAVDDLVHITFQ